jgi:hypothetical protein
MHPRCWQGLLWEPFHCHKGVQSFPASAPAGKEEEHRAGLQWLGPTLPSEAWEAICLLYQLSSPAHLSVAIRHDLFMLAHWQLPDTVSQTSLEANYHANCQRQKTLPDCCPTSTPAYKSFLNKTAQNKQSATLMQLQLSRETICPRFRVITRGPSSVLTNQNISIKGN